MCQANRRAAPKRTGKEALTGPAGFGARLLTA